MYQPIPADQVHSERIGEHVIATGYKSRRWRYDEGHNNGKIDPEGAMLVVKTDGWIGSPIFEFTVDNRTALLKLRKAIDFALEIKEEENAPDKTE